MKDKPFSTLDATLAPTCADPDPLTPEAVAFVLRLARRFQGRLDELLALRRERQAAFDQGQRPDFLPETDSIRRGHWAVAALPPALLDRRVEITGPPDRKMLINAMNSGAQVYMADFEDSLAPSLDNLLAGQRNLFLAVRGALEHRDPASGRIRRLEAHTATLMVRPRGLHLLEPHLERDGRPVPACLFDAGLFLFHNARELHGRGAGPYLYLPKLEHHLESAWWNEVLEAVELELGLPFGCIRTTMLIETLPAAFQMEEILHAQRIRAAGLNLGRWDYLFSFIKTLRRDRGAVLPERGAIAMDQPFLRAYARLLVRTCHRRGCSAMGGMSAFVPRKDDPEASERALAQVRADKLREVQDGCDGTWVAHPALVPLAQEVFARHMAGTNQFQRIPEPVAAAELLQVPEGPVTLAGLCHNLRVGIHYLESWLRGQGCLALYGLMEDTATAEICRMQVWQWLHHGVEVAGLGRLERPLFHAQMDYALDQVRAELGFEAFADGRYLDAADLLESLILQPEPEPFLTGPAYGRLALQALPEAI
jgi:malate synthase